MVIPTDVLLSNTVDHTSDSTQPHGSPVRPRLALGVRLAWDKLPWEEVPSLAYCIRLHNIVIIHISYILVNSTPPVLEKKNNKKKWLELTVIIHFVFLQIHLSNSCK